MHEAWELFDHEEMIERLLKQTEYIDFESNTYKAPKTLKRKHSELLRVRFTKITSKFVHRPTMLLHRRSFAIWAFCG